MVIFKAEETACTKALRWERHGLFETKQKCPKIPSITYVQKAVERMVYDRTHEVGKSQTLCMTINMYSLWPTFIEHLICLETMLNVYMCLSIKSL